VCLALKPSISMPVCVMPICVSVCLVVVLLVAVLSINQSNELSIYLSIYLFG